MLILPPARREEVRTAVQRHLGAFGPATVDDISSWSSIRTPAIRIALQGLGSKVRTFTDPRGRVLYDQRRFAEALDDSSRAFSSESPPRT